MAHVEFEQHVRQPLERLSRRLRSLRAAQGASVVAIVALVLFFCQLVLDWWLRLRLDMRAVLLLVVLTGCGWSLWRFALAPLRLRFGAREMALAVERRHPQLNAVLLSALDFDAGDVGDASANSPDLVESVIADATGAARDVAFDELIDTRPGRRAVIRIMGVLAVVVFAFAAAPQSMGIWVDRNLLLREVSWPQRSELIVEVPEDGVIHGAIGDDLDIRAHVPPAYEVPRQVEIIYETKSGATGRETMTGVGERGFRVTFPRVREDFTFYLVGNDDVTERYAVHLSERPRIESAEITIEPASYTGLPAQTLPDGQRVAELYPGGSLTIRATASKPLTEAVLRTERAVVATLDVNERALEARITPMESQTYHFELRDADGLANMRPARFSARLLEDRAPKVRMHAANVGNLVTARAVLPLELSFADELGLAEAVLIYKHSGAEGASSALPLEGFSPGAREFDVARQWSVAEAGAAVGDEVTLIARGQDFNNVTGPGIGESTTLTFRVAEDDELLADFHRREQEYRRQFDRLVDSQDRLRRQLLSLLSKANEANVRKDLELTLAPLERRQRQIMSQVNVVRQQFEQILAEMAINRLDDDEVRHRMRDGIIDPLERLGTREMSDAADQLRRLGRERTMAGAQAVDPVQADITEKMRQVRDNMLKWEGYQETVSMLREILRLQREVNEETREELEHSGNEFFED
ncbi:MAG: hypothetical protein H6817_07020 [Phycisphaerales bacterium]|nr:hypothetical protein [Phycisphaerales bacterium]